MRTICQWFLMVPGTPGGARVWGTFLQQLVVLFWGKSCLQQNIWSNKNPGNPYQSRLPGLVGLVGLEPMSTIRNRVLAALPLARTLCSLGLRLAFAFGECSAQGHCSALAPPRCQWIVKVSLIWWFLSSSFVCSGHLVRMGGDIIYK